MRKYSDYFLFYGGLWHYFIKSLALNTTNNYLCRSTFKHLDI
jgi:hypothetical protein